MDMRERLRRVQGLFVELPPDRPPAVRVTFDTGVMDTPVDPIPTPTRTVEQLVRDSDGPNLDDITVPNGHTKIDVGTDGKADFQPVYKQAGLPTAPFTAEQMLDLLASLPASLPLETRRQTVKVTLEALTHSIGATSDTIVADASRKLAALTSYAETLDKQTKQTISSSEQEIASLQAQIEAKRKEVADSRQELDQAVSLCSKESDRLDDVLEFFSLDVPPSKLSPHN